MRLVRAAARAALAVAVVAIFHPVLERTAWRDAYGDYRWHGRSAARLAASGRPETPHPLFPLLVAAAASLRSQPRWRDTAVQVALCAQVVLALLLAARLERAWPGGRVVAAALGASALALALMSSSAVNLGSWSTRNVYAGYVVPNVHHNPTFLLMRPFALAHWLITAQVMTANPRATGYAGIAALALLGVLAALAKPSYALIVLPAVAVLAGIRWARREPFDGRALLLGAALPTLAVLAWQYVVTFGEDAVVEWAPLRVMRGFPGSPFRLALAVLYPAVAAAAFFHAAVRDVRLALAWLGLGFGVGYAYLLTESGARSGHANFLWSAHAGAFLLFVATSLFLLEQAGRAPRRGALRLPLCGAAFALHLIGGVYALAHPRWS
jgi:hypothetical protein